MNVARRLADFIQQGKLFSWVWNPCINTIRSEWSEIWQLAKQQIVDMKLIQQGLA